MRVAALAAALAGALGALGGAAAWAAPNPFGEDAPEHLLPDRPWRTEHVGVELWLDPVHPGVEGVATLRLRARQRRPAPSEVRLRLADMTVDEASLGGAPAAVHREGEWVVVALSAPAKPDQPIEVRLRYHGGPPRAGLYFIHPVEGAQDRPFEVWSQGEAESNHYWFPCVDYPSERFTWSLTVHTPRRFVVVSNGRLDGPRDDPQREGWRVWRWHMDLPHVAYLVSIVVGEYEAVEAKWRDVPVRGWVHPRDLERARTVFARVPAMIEFFSTYTGVAYPYSKYDQVVVTDFVAGGMENVTATTLLEESIYPASVEPWYDVDGLLAHELAHQWFGDWVTTRGWPHLWLNEGFASFMAALWFEHAKGPDEYADRIARMQAWYFGAGREHPIVPRRVRSPGALFDAHTYGKGALVLNMLRNLVGDAGLRVGIRRYLERYGKGLAVTQDFQRAVEEATGTALGWFFHQWTEVAGHPTLDVAWRWDAARKVVVLDVRQTQDAGPVHAGGERWYRLPTDAWLLDAKGHLRRVPVTLTGRRQVLVVATPARPVAAGLDPDGALVAEWKRHWSQDGLVACLRKPPTPALRIAALEDASNFAGSPRVVEALAALLAPGVHHAYGSRAAKALGAMRVPAAREALLAAARNGDLDARVRAAATRALGSHRVWRKAVLPVLARLATDDDVSLVRAAAFDALGNLEAPETLDLARRALRHPTFGHRVERAALYAVAKLDDPGAYELLTTWCRLGAPRRLRPAALDALANWVADHPERVHDVRSAEDLVVPMLDDPIPRVRGASVAALGKMGTPRVVAALRGFAARASHGGALAAADAIADIEDRAASKTKVPELRRKLRKLRQRVDDLEKDVEALGKSP